MNIDNIIKKIEQEYPLDIQETWDNSGIQIKSKSNVSKICVCLDVTKKVIDECIKNKIDLIISHHPLFFENLKCIDTNYDKGILINLLVKNKINVYSMHTNFDKIDMTKIVMSKLSPKHNFDVLDEEGKYGACYSLGKSVKVSEFAKKIKSVFKLQDVRVYGDLKTIDKVALMPGSGKSFISNAVNKNCNAFVSGDIDYHTGIEASLKNIVVFDCGHQGLEQFFVSYLKNKIAKMFPNLDIIMIKEQVYKLI